MFDLDGTLVDPVEGITLCLADALEAVGVRVDDRRALARHIGPPLADTLRSYGLSEHRVDEAIAVYRERFDIDGLTGMYVHPGMHDLLVDLARTDVRVGVATSKPWVIARRVIEAMGLAALVDPVAGPELHEADAAKHLVIARAMEELGHPDPSQVVMVGDRRHDIAGARHHGIDAIAVTWGFGSEIELTAAEPKAIAGSASDLRLLLLGTA